MYYAAEINRYYFVFSAVKATMCRPISVTNSWRLEETLGEASQGNKPVFVISHWPMNGTHGLPETWGDKEPRPEDSGFGEQSARVGAILKKRNVFLLSGHITLAQTALPNTFTVTTV